MRWIIMICLALWAAIAQAEPMRYALDGSASRVEFLFDVEGLAITGQVPVASADVIVDFDDLGRSSVDVQLNVARAQTNLPFATEAMKGGSVLSTATFPQARFVSRKIIRLGDGARLEGLLTLRGVSRTVVLDGAIFRERGSVPGDLSDPVLLFNGAVNRHDFGASGYQHLVDDQVRLRILVAIRRVS